MIDPLNKEHRKSRWALVLGGIVLVFGALYAFRPHGNPEDAFLISGSLQESDLDGEQPADLDRSGFQRAVLWPGGAKEAIDAEEDSRRETGSIALVGIVIMKDEPNRQAALWTQEQLALLSVGERWGSLTLVDVQADRVRLQDGSREWQLFLEDGPRFLGWEDR